MTPVDDRNNISIICRYFKYASNVYFFLSLDFESGKNSRLNMADSATGA